MSSSMKKMRIFILLGSLLLAPMIACIHSNSWVASKGSYMSADVDKATWGDFELELRIERPVFEVGEPIRVLLVFRNTGDKTITLDGILPMRQSANPPSLDVTTPDGGRLRSYGDGVPNALLTDKPIVVEPGKTITLVDADLRSLSGSVHPPGKEGHQGTFKEQLHAGKYQISGRFAPTPQIYWSRTAPLEFQIK
jgi:hypothetical protein